MSESEKVCIDCEAPVKEGQYCEKQGEIRCLNCVLKTMDLIPPVPSVVISMVNNLLSATRARSSQALHLDPLALDMKCSARQLSILLLGHAQAISMKAYDTQAIKTDVDGRLAVLNEVDRIVELVQKLDLVADKIIARGE